MPVIDVHSHVWRLGIDISREYVEIYCKMLSRYPSWREPPGTSRVENFTTTYEDSLENMDKSGVDISVINGAYDYRPLRPESGWTNVRNDYIAEAQNKYPDRFIGFASIDPLGGDRSVREIDRAIFELGLKGIGELTVVYCEAALDDPRLDPVYRRCEELARESGIPLDVHAGFTLHTWTYLEKQDPALLWHVLEKFPELKITVAHPGAGGTWDKALHLAVAWPNVYLDFAFLPRVYPPFKLMEFLQHAKWAGILDKCLWGTDYPSSDRQDSLDMYRKFPAESERLGVEPVLTDEDIEGFLGGNAEKYLGLK